MQRQKLKFDQQPAVAGTTYLRIVADEPCFHLIDSQTRQRARIANPTLHIDFMRAELYPDDVGHGARGLGYVDFGPGGPQIVSRRLRTDHSADDASYAGYGFVFDVASPYAQVNLPRGLRNHPVGSTLRTAVDAFSRAYDEYDRYISGVPSLGGVPVPRGVGYCVPVFDVIGWRKVGGTEEDTNMAPILELVGTVTHIEQPLSPEARERFAKELGRDVPEPVPQESPTRGGLADETGGRAAPKGNTDPIPNRNYRPRLRTPLRPNA